MQQPAKRWIVEQLATSAIVARGPLGKAWRFFSRDVWLAEVDHFGTARRALYRVCRIAFLALKSFAGDRCVIRAGALTYTTVLSLVPMLAFSFAMLKGLGFYDELRTTRIDPYLDGLFGKLEPAATIELPLAPIMQAPAPEQGMLQLREGFDRVLGLVDHTNLKGLGFVGLLVLMLAALRLLSSVEASFNEIWGVRKARTWVRKLSDYLTIVIVTPLFLVVAIGVTTAAQNAGVVEFLDKKLALGFLIEALIRIAPVLIGWAAFTLVYLVMPNRRTKFASAALGGFVAGLAWQAALVLHIKFQIGVANYSAIYAGFAALPVFLVWVQLSWLIVLFGAELAFAHESEREYRGFAGYEQHAHAFREQVALRALTRICDAFQAGKPARGARSIAAGLGLAPREVEEVLHDLVRGKLVAQVDGAESGDGAGYMPARDPGRITVVNVLEVLRGEGLDAGVAAESELDRHVDKLMAQLDEEARTSAHNRTLRDLVEEARRREALAAPNAPQLRAQTS